MQQQFLANTEDAIQSPVDLPSQITRYQNALKYARTKVDYVFGFGLYMAPSDMELRIETIQTYNNKIILSRHDQKLWWNATVNRSADATSYSGDVSGTTTWKSIPEADTSATVLSKSRKENPQKLTQLSSRSHPRHLVAKRTAQKDITIDTTSDSQVNSNFPNRWLPASLTFNNYFYLF